LLWDVDVEAVLRKARNSAYWSEKALVFAADAIEILIMDDS
jgi:hypothetical protein